MKTLRLLITLVLGAYLLAMALQFVGICRMLIREGRSPFAPDAPAAFFTNLIAWLGSALVIWAVWRLRMPRARSGIKVKEA